MSSPAATTMSRATLEELKCVLCSLYLSVPPISYNKKNKFVCGRCYQPKIRDDSLCCTAVAYETIAELLHFPCRYVSKGCKEENLEWKAVRDHENSCTYQESKCPLEFLYCKWEGKPELLYDHFLKEHEEEILNTDTFNLNLTQDSQKIFLKPAKDCVFLIYIKVQVKDKKVQFGLYYVDKPAKNYCYKLELTSAKGLTTKMVTFIESCIVKHSLISYKVYQIPINIDDVKNILGNSLACRLAIIKENSTSVNASEARSVVDKELLPDLQCPGCKKYFTPPMYLCPNGHTICKDCKTEFGYCAVCEEPLRDKRNIKVEQIIVHMNYPCKNETFGCKFIGNCKTINNHNEECAVKPIKCPLSSLEQCFWEDTAKNHIEHVIANHSKKLLNMSGDNEVVVTRNLTSKKMITYNVMHYDDQLFNICCKHSRGFVWWRFQHVGLEPTKTSAYKFQIEFYDQTSLGRTFIINDLCLATIDEKLSHEWLAIPIELLTPFIDNKTVIFSYKIVKD